MYRRCLVPFPESWSQNLKFVTRGVSEGGENSVFLSLVYASGYERTVLKPAVVS